MSLKELKCAILGHIWSETGKMKCMRHEKEYAHYRICERCKLQENLSSKTCTMCLVEYQAKFDEGAK